MFEKLDAVKGQVEASMGPCLKNLKLRRCQGIERRCEVLGEETGRQSCTEAWD
jgi:hypothetical protein